MKLWDILSVQFIFAHRHKRDGFRECDHRCWRDLLHHQGVYCWVPTRMLLRKGLLDNHFGVLWFSVFENDFNASRIKNFIFNYCGVSTLIYFPHAYLVRTPRNPKYVTILTRRISFRGLLSHVVDANQFHSLPHKYLQKDGSGGVAVTTYVSVSRNLGNLWTADTESGVT